MSLKSEFKEFILKGNVVDLAVGVVIGGAFGVIVTSLVNDIIMPPIGVLIGGQNFADYKFILKDGGIDAAGKAFDAVSINYGKFFQVLLNFLVVALAIFLLIVKPMNAMKRKPVPAPATPPPPTNEEVLLTQIRDLLKK